MDKSFPSKDFFHENDLIIEINAQRTEKHRHKITITVKDMNTLLSISTLYLQLSKKETLSFSSIKDLKDYLLKTYASLEKIQIYQKVYVTYLNEIEAKAFNQKIGSPAILIEKTFEFNGKTIMKEHEICRTDAYIFKERDYFE